MNSPRWLATAIPVIFALAGVAGSIAARMEVQQGQAERTELAFERMADQVCTSMQLELDVYEQGLRSLVGLFHASDEVTRADFRLFTSHSLDRLEGIQAFEWVPRVDGADRAAMVEAVHAEGLPGFRFTERDANGSIVLAPQREEYFPILFVEPFSGNELAFGYADRGEARYEAIQRARDSGQAAVSRRLTLIQETGSQFGLLVFYPVFDGVIDPGDRDARREALMGFVEGVYRVDDLFGQGFRDADRRGLAAVVTSEYDGDARPLFISPGNGLPAEPSQMSDEQAQELLASYATQLSHQHGLRFADQELTVQVRPTTDFRTASAAWLPNAVLLWGLALTAALTSSLVLYRRRTVLIEQLVERRTAELRQSQEQLLQAQKMESVGRLAGGVAHDFNNMLTAILGGTQLASMALEPDHRIQPELRQIEHASLRAADLTRQLLAFSRRQMLQPTSLDLHGLVDDMQGMLGRMIGDHVTIRTQLGDDPLWVHADAGQLEQIVVNLTVNARDALPDGGTITIGAADGETLEGRRGILLWVEDDGTGMDEATRAQVFEPFFTTKELGKGTGLGLSTVYGIVKQSGGQIEVHSEPGQGTRFDIVLPAGTPAPKPEHAPRRRQDDETLGDYGVLVVEDDPSVRQNVTEILHQAGCRVWSAAHGEEGLEIHERLGSQVDLVVTDVVMPHISGPELVQALRQRAPRLPIVMMTGYAPDDVAKDLDRGHDAILLGKPFGRGELLRAVGQALSSPRRQRGA